MQKGLCTCLHDAVAADDGDFQANLQHGDLIGPSLLIILPRVVNSNPAWRFIKSASPHSNGLFFFFMDPEKLCYHAGIQTATNV